MAGRTVGDVRKGGAGDRAGGGRADGMRLTRRCDANGDRGVLTAGDLRLVYTGAAGEGGGDLFGLTGDGHVRRLTTDGGSFDPAFSPDGSRIVFSSIGEDGSANGDTGVSGLDLHIMAADGSGRRRLLDGDEDGMPAWSPDGHPSGRLGQGSDPGRRSGRPWVGPHARRTGRRYR